MKNLARSTALLVVIAILAGCTPIIHETEPDTPPPTISKASFVAGDGFTAQITGEFFKMKSNNKDDVVVSLNGQNWIPASKVSESSPTKYLVLLPYGVSYPQIWVRVFGMDGKYSEPVLVQGWVK